MGTEISISRSTSGGGSGTTPVGATLMKTGQTTSYRTGDDGDIEAGRATDFFTLANANPFGTTARFTDELGGSTYANDIVIDWSTYDNIAGTVLGYYRIKQGTDVWTDAIDNALTFSIGSFSSGWRLTNIRELDNILNYGAQRGLGYVPFNDTSNDSFYTSTTLAAAPTVVFFRGNQLNVSGTSNTTTLRYWIPVRTFTVSGTTLT